MEPIRRTTWQASRSHSEARPEQTQLPPTPQLTEGRIDPQLGDIYTLLQHINEKIKQIEEQITSLEGLAIDAETTIGQLKQDIQQVQAVSNGTQSMLSRLEEEIHKNQPGTPTGKNTPAHEDVEPTPRPSSSH